MKKIIAIPALAFSLFVYLFYRSSATVAPLVCAHLLGHERFAAMRKAVRAAVALDDFAVYSLPEGLWILCLTLASTGLSFSVKKRRIPLALLPPVYAVGLEFAQRWGLIRGRFDPVDIAVSLSFWIAGVLFHPRVATQDSLKPDRRGLVLVVCWSIVYFAHVCS